MTRGFRFLLLLTLGLFPMSGRAQEHGHGQGAMPHGMGGGGGACSEPKLACASSAAPYFAPDGSPWLVWAAGGQVSVARSDDKGEHFGDPVAVTPAPVRIDDGPDSRPRIVVDAAGRVTVSYAMFRDEHWNGEVFVSRSVDIGRHFSEPVPIANGSPSQRFQAMALDSDGRVFAAWLDKRNVAPARARGEKYPGAALAFAWSDADGKTFAHARIAADDTCECCRLGIGFAGPGRPVVAFRNIFGENIRDHALIVFADRDTPGSVHRISEDNWAIDGCPHQGPSLAVSASGTVHVAWFTGGGVRRGLFAARSTDGGTTFSAPMPVGDAGRQNSRPALLAVGGRVFLAWKSFDGEHTDIRLMVSRDDGATWGAARTVAATGDESDQPLLVADGTTAFLSWLTHEEGYRLIALGPGS